MVLRNARNDVLAAGSDNDFLLASHNLQQPGLVELGQVAGAEPTILGERLGVLLGVLVVPLHDAHTAHQQLAVLGDGTLGTRKKRANPTNLIRVDTPGRDGGAGLGQAVALDDLHAHRVEEVREALAQRAASGDRVV